jgi:uncharacterized protein YcbK (DUF882 family)
MNLAMNPARISIQEYLGDHARNFAMSLTEDVMKNATATVERVNQLFQALEIAGIKVERNSQGNYLNSGWRPAAYNATVKGAAVKSKHITAEAADLYDPDGAIDDYLMDNQIVLAGLGLYMEHPSATKGWCHVQLVPPRSGRRVFYP